jgi:hypothetical protein
MRKDGDKLQANFRGTIYEIDNTSDAIKDWIVEMGRTKGISGSMGGQMATLGGMFSNLRDKLFEVNTEIAEKFRPQITSVVSVLGGFITKIPGMIDWILKYKREIQAFGGMLVTIFAVRRITGFLKGLRDVNSVFRMFNKTVNANKLIVILWASIQALMILRRLWEGFRESFGHMIGLDVSESSALGTYTKNQKVIESFKQQQEELQEQFDKGTISINEYQNEMDRLFNNPKYIRNLKSQENLLKQHPELAEKYKALTSKTTDELTIDDLIKQTQSEMKKAESNIEQEYGISANVNRTAKHITINIGKQIETLNLMPQTLTEGEYDLEERMTQLFRRIIVNMST